jgi:flagellar biosynthesis GTPase FlhF
VFNQILSLDQATRQGGDAAVAVDLKHKTPLSRAPVMAGMFAAPGGEGEEPARQLLRPVAMPGGPALPTFPSTGMNAEAPGPPPQVPVRSPLRSSLLTGVYDPLPHHRPISDLSLISDFSTTTGGDTASVMTRQSVNEILSLAEGSIYSEDGLNLDSISVNSMLNVAGAGMLEVKQEPPEVEAMGPRNSVRHPLGSLTSVATVKEVLLQPAAQGSQQSLGMVQPEQDPSSTSATTPLPMDITEDLGQIYDDVMQCVYDDVDVKYDDLALDEPGEAPVPPPRMRSGSTDHGLEKPLPGVPRNKIISKLEEKKNELTLLRSKEAEKRRQIEEQRRKEREVVEEQKRLEREEKEKRKQEEREKKRLEEEQKKAQKKKEEDEKKAKKVAEMEDEAKMKQSLFQRLFARSQSRTEQEEADSTVEAGGPPPVPPHGPLTAHLGEVDGQLGELEQLMEGAMQPGDLQRLDSLVTEFTNQFPPEPSESSVKS